MHGDLRTVAIAVAAALVVLAIANRFKIPLVDPAALSSPPAPAT